MGHQNKPIKDFQYKKDITVKDFVNQLSSIGFQATELNKCVEVIKNMKKNKAKIILQFTSNMGTSGLRGLFAYLAKIKFMGIVICTAGAIEEDIIKSNDINFYEKGSFRITSKRLTKDFLTSQKLNEKVGEFILKNTEAKVNLTKPNVEIGIEIINDNAYLFNKKNRCLGGLPVGIEGKVTLILENKDSILAGILMLKRGCSLEVIKEKNIDYEKLKEFSYGNKILEVEKPSEYSKAVIVADTIKNLRDRGYEITVFRPLIGYDKKRTERLNFNSI